MSDPLEQALRGLGGRLLDAMMRDAELRQSLRDVARALLTEDVVALETAPVPEPEAAAPPPAPEPPQLPDLAGALEKLSLHYGEGGTREIAPQPARGDGLEVDKVVKPDEPTGDGPPPELLETIAANCRLKAEAVDALLGTMGDAPEVRAEAFQDLSSRASRAKDGALWMLHAPDPEPASIDHWCMLRDAYAELGEALAWLRIVVSAELQNKEHIKDGLHRAAAAQSALRAACQLIGQKDEQSQMQAFIWLRDYASQRRFYISRHMREQDKADPKASRARMEVLRAEREAFEQKVNRKNDRRKLLNKVKYHAQKIQKSGGAELASDWDTIATAVADLIDDGLPPSNTELRALLLPVVDSLPDELEDTPKLDLVLREMDNYLANVGGVGVDAESAPSCHEANADIEQARKLLAGQPVVLIGGDSRPQAKAALEESLGISELIWLSSRPHQSIEGFKPYIQREDVALVILAIRWSSHSFGDVKAYCDEVGKPLVRLPAGYHPNQVARQIIEQASQRLAA